jgi:hypothetical protein
MKEEGMMLKHWDAHTEKAANVRAHLDTRSLRAQYDADPSSHQPGCYAV